MARYFWNSKRAMWTQTYQLRPKNFLSRKVFQKISKSKKTVWLFELSLCPLENQNSAKDLQQSSVQKSNEYKLACTGTVYLKRLFEFLKKVTPMIQKADYHFQLSVKAIFWHWHRLFEKVIWILKSHANYSKCWLPFSIVG